MVAYASTTDTAPAARSVVARAYASTTDDADNARFAVARQTPKLLTRNRRNPRIRRHNKSQGDQESQAIEADLRCKVSLQGFAYCGCSVALGMNNTFTSMNMSSCLIFSLCRHIKTHVPGSFVCSYSKLLLNASYGGCLLIELH